MVIQSSDLCGEVKDRSKHQLPASTLQNEQEYDLNVGILECGTDQECVPSTMSKPGKGVCRSIIVEEENESRELQREFWITNVNITVTIPYDCFYRSMCSYQDGVLDCDRKIFNVITYEGEFSCNYGAWCDLNAFKGQCYPLRRQD